MTKRQAYAAMLAGLKVTHFQFKYPNIDYIFMDEDGDIIDNTGEFYDNIGALATDRWEIYDG